MSAGPTRCSKCNGAMVQGLSFESQGPKRVVTTWVEGAPEKTFWGGSNVPADKCIAVGTFRCSECGSLEPYARPEFAAK